MTSGEWQLEDVVSRLARHSQRATYGAVGGVVGRIARSVMSGQPKTPANSFVVSASSGEPTGYTQSERHTSLRARASVISSAAALAVWLREHS
nr:hypothetical protein [uncultured bacterium]